MHWRLFSTPTDKPLHAAEHTTLPSAPLLAESRTAFVPPVEVAVDEDKIEHPGGFHLFVEDVSVNAGVTSDQLFVSRSTIYMSDMLGDRRFVASLDSVSSFSNFDLLYLDLRRRTNWGFRVFDNRSFYTTLNASGDSFDRRQLYRETGAFALISHPFDRYHRLDSGVGYEARDVHYPVYQSDGTLALFDYRDKFPIVSADFSGDTTVFREFGPLTGHRYDVGAAFAPNATTDLTLDARQYLQITQRSLLAARLFVGHSVGRKPNFYYFGGLNTLRGYDFYSIVGTEAAYANVEFRFPLIDILQMPFMRLDGVRGNFFFDIGGAKLPGQQYTFMQHGRLVNGVAAVGYGVSFNFLGLELHWDFAKRTDLKQSYGKARTEFWIGETF